MNIRRGEQGSALMIAIIIVIIVGGIGGAFMVETLARGNQQFVSMQMDEAQIICDAAIEKARRDLWYYKNYGTWTWNDILTYCNDNTCVPTSDLDTLWTTWASQKSSSVNTALEAALAGYTFTGASSTNTAPSTPGNSTTPSSSDTVHLGWCRPFGEGGACYHVVVKDNNDGDGNLLADVDNKLILVVTATLPNGTQKQVEVLIEYQTSNFSPEAGVLSDGTIEMTGGIISGTKGRVFSNEAIYANSQTTASQGLSAVTQVYDSNGSNYSGTQTANDSDTGTAPVAVTIPDPSTINWLSKTIFPQSGATQALKLKSGGTMEIVNLSTGATSTPSAADIASKYNQFDWSNAQSRWTMNNAAPSATNQDHIVFVETDFIAGTNDSWRLSVISEGSITWTGGGNYNPATISTSAGQPVNAVGLIAYKDLKIAGNGSSQKNGLFLAGEQVGLSGTVSITGSVISKDKPDTAGSVVGPQGTVAEGFDLNGTGVGVVFNAMATTIPVGTDSVKVNTLRRVNARTKKH